MSTALLIIDVQQALCSGTYATFDAARIIDNINGISEKLRAAGAPVIVVQHESNSGPFERDGEGWQLPAALVVKDADLRLGKQGSDAFHQTPLQTLLQSHGVSELIVCGMQSEFCVDSTVRRAMALGYPVTLVSDGHTTIANGVLSAAQISAHHNVTLSELTSYGARTRLTAAADVVIPIYV
ncbi:cysteine hydrolase family protein [Herbaspirillum lusitanum]|jgi:nicotinamidase-related amidase|uniref:Cysteine hydrolase family protein n=1 Tax=Herbaspirillum lusitanum TaxID=213312 RepID=A0ABW9A5I1_9BURK